MVLARDRIVHWLLDGGKFSISARAKLATNFRAQVLLSEGSAHSFGGFVRKLKFCTARNGKLLFMFIVANVHMRGVPFISKQAMEEKCLPYWIWNPLLFFFLGLLYSRGNGFGNKAEVTFHCIS